MEVIPGGMTLPSELQFKVSQLEDNKIGVWTRKQVNKGRLYGPFKGERKPCADVANDTYSWQIVGPKGRRLFCVDASDPTKGNWMRYVKTAPNRELHNLHPVQHKKKIYYKVLTTLKKDTELLCWYDGATDPEIQEGELLPMPVLEKMDLLKDSEDEVHRVLRRIPSPLELMALAGVSEGLEPPLISPAYPDNHPSGMAGRPLEGIQTVCPLTEEIASTCPSKVSSLLTSLDAVVAIQAPDVSSSGELISETEGILKMTNFEKEPVTSSNQLTGVQRTQHSKKIQSSKDSKNYKKVKKKGAAKPCKDPEVESVLPKGKSKFLKDKGKSCKDRVEREVITEPYVIGPDSIVNNDDGSEKYRCRLCGKLCKYPVGLKIHLRTSHCYINVHIRGIAKKPWARGIALKREKEEREAAGAMLDTTGNPGEPPVTTGNPEMSPVETWTSVDRCLVQTALEKLHNQSTQAGKSEEQLEQGGESSTAQKSFADAAQEAVDAATPPQNRDVAEDMITVDKLLPFREQLVAGDKDNPLDSFVNFRSADKAVISSKESRKHSSKHKRKRSKDSFGRKGSRDRDTALRKTNGKDSFARKQSQTIIALSELSISETSDSDPSPTKLSQENVVDLSRSSKPKIIGPRSDSGDSGQLQDGESPKKERFILPKKFSCPLCHQAFAYQVWMDRHLKMHSESVNGFNCDTCSLKFFSKKDLNLHRTLHSSPGPQPKNVPSDTPVDFCNTSEVVPGQSRSNSNGGAKVAPGKTRENMNLAKLVASLQKNQEKSSSAVESAKAPSKEEKGTRKRQRVGQSGGITKKYICRLCLATFANPSNRCRHMRLIHGLTQKKKPSENKPGSSSSSVDSEKSSVGDHSSSVRTSTDSQGDVSSDALPSSPLRSIKPLPVRTSTPEKENSIVKSPLRKSAKNENPALKKSSPQKSSKTSPKKQTLQKVPSPMKKVSSSKRIEVPVLFGYWRNAPETQIVENHVQAHVRKSSKRRNVAPSNPIQEFPRNPGIHSPWNGANKPVPYVPRPRPVPSLSSFVFRSEQPTDLSRKSTAKLPQSVELEDNADKHVNDPGNVEPSKTRASPPMDLSNENFFRHKHVEKSAEMINTIIGRQNSAVDSSLSHTCSSSSKLPPQDCPTSKAPETTTSKMSSPGSLQCTPPPAANPVEWHFTCNICSCNFAGIRELSRHVIAHAEDYPYKCEFCMRVYTLVDKLQEHKESRHKVKTRYACSVCKEEFAYLSNLENHQVETHPGVRCTFEDNLSNVVRPQNFTDPTKAFNLRSKPPEEAKEKVSSYLKEEMSKLIPMKRRNSTQEKDKSSGGPVTKKATPEKGLLFNPQRNHPFEQRRKIGYLSMLSDPRNQKQLGSKVTSNVCTKCLQEFKETAAFHIHIMECASIKGDLLSLKAKGADSSSSVGSKAHQQKKPKNVIGKVSKKSSKISRRGRVCSSRQKPGTVAYDPQKYLRARAAATKTAFDDIHSCGGCGKKFYFINQLERHMKMCPNREKLVNASKSTVALALRKRPRANTMQHKCTNCEKHFTYLGSLEKHLLMCTRGDVEAAL